MLDMPSLFRGDPSPSTGLLLSRGPCRGRICLIPFFRNPVNPGVRRERMRVCLHSPLVLPDRGQLHPFSQQLSSLSLPEEPVRLV
eukprot:25000_5